MQIASLDKKYNIIIRIIQIKNMYYKNSNAIQKYFNELLMLNR